MNLIITEEHWPDSYELLSLLFQDEGQMFHSLRFLVFAGVPKKRRRYVRSLSPYLCSWFSAY